MSAKQYFYLHFFFHLLITLTSKIASYPYVILVTLFHEPYQTTSLQIASTTYALVCAFFCACTEHDC